VTRPIIPIMTARERPVDRARRLARADRVRAGLEIRQARLALGRSQALVGREARMSGSQVGRIERGELTLGDHDALVRLAAVVRLDARLRLYPGPDGALDGPQLRRIERLRAIVPMAVSIQTEVPLPNPGDQRAWDVVLGGLTGNRDTDQMPVEVETRLHDIQSMTRRIQLKLRDSPFDSVMLVVADTKHNRTVLAAHRATLASVFPIGSRACLAALRAGRHPGGSALILL
jgi:transcriptional regulator with XRE-family HTH domain